MENTRKNKRYLFGVAMLIAVFTLSSYAVLAANVSSGNTYSDHSGNYSGMYKIDGYQNKTVYFKADMTVSSQPTSRYIVFTTTNHKYVAFTATNVMVSSVYVKGGNGYRIYNFDPAVSSASNLSSPQNGGWNVPDISHYGIVCVQLPIVIPPTTTTTIPTQTTTAPTETTAPSETTAPTETTAPSETTAPTETTAPSETTAPTETTAPSETTAPTGTTATGEVLGVFRDATPTTSETTADPSAVAGLTKTGESGIDVTTGVGIVLLVAFAAAGTVFFVSHRKNQE